MNKIIDIANNSNVYEVAKVSNLSKANRLSKSFSNQIYLKREDEQVIRSFKLRGAYQKISLLTQKQKDQGVIASSAGNHAQGVALAAKKLNIKAKIVMPVNTPEIKYQSVADMGAEVILFGDVYDDAYNHAKEIAENENLFFIHPYDDIEVIAGQATIAKEILEQLEDIDFIFVPVGGGGLISGIASYVKHYKPNIKIIGVEPEDSPTLSYALKNNSLLPLTEVGRFADGVAVKQIGKITFEIAKNTVDDVILISNDEMCAAIKDIYEDVRAISEPSGALCTAGAKRYIKEHKITNKNIVTIISGANVNFDRLRYISERADLGDLTEAIFAVTIPEQPGSFLNFCKHLNNQSITEFNYRYSDKFNANIFVGIKLKNGDIEKQKLIKNIKKDFNIIDMSDNSMAKTHVRYMVGGRSVIDDECIYRFEFPERPGALLDFLEKIGNKWNISLFHYRNHGSDFGRVLIGLQAQDKIKLENSFDEIGYFYKNESENKAYKYFL